MLWHCWFGVRKSIRPVKTEWWGSGMVVPFGARCKWFVYGPADATVTPSFFSFIQIQIGLTFLVPAYPARLSWEWTRPLNGCLSVCVVYYLTWCGVCRQDDKDIQDPAAGTYYLVILAYVVPGFALLMLLVHLITWRQKLGQLRKDADGQQSSFTYLFCCLYLYLAYVTFLEAYMCFCWDLFLCSFQLLPRDAYL